jgi:predicted nucleic acid-binding Zn ribbon protein
MKKNDRSTGYRTRNDKVFCSDRCRGRYHYHYRQKSKPQNAVS